jgi:hypothetical protein
MEKKERKKKICETKKYKNERMKEEKEKEKEKDEVAIKI